MKCPYCHQEVAPGEQFCRNCGAMLDAAQTNSDSAYDEQVQQPPKREAPPVADMPMSETASEAGNNRLIIIVAIVAAVAVVIAAYFLVFRDNSSAGSASGQSSSSASSESNTTKSLADDDDETDAYDEDEEDDEDDSSDIFNSDAMTDSSGYVMPDSDSEYFTRSELEALTSRELSYGRNEVYAKHHYAFKTATFQDYFNSKTWYDGYLTEDEFDDSVLNSYERANVELMKDVESSKGMYEP